MQNWSNQPVVVLRNSTKDYCTQTRVKNKFWKPANNNHNNHNKKTKRVRKKNELRIQYKTRLIKRCPSTETEAETEATTNALHKPKFPLL